MMPLVIKAATDAAAGQAKAATAMVSLEGAIEKHTSAIEMWATARERENKLKEQELELLGRQEQNRHEEKKGLIGWFQNTFTGALLIEILVIIGTGLGLWTQIPQTNPPVQSHVAPVTAPAPQPFVP